MSHGELLVCWLAIFLALIGPQPQRDVRSLHHPLYHTYQAPAYTNLMLMVLVSWGGGEVYSSTSTSSSAGHGNNFGGGSSIPLHTTRRSSLIPSVLDDPRSHHG